MLLFWLVLCLLRWASSSPCEVGRRSWARRGGCTVEPARVRRLMIRALCVVAVGIASVQAYAWQPEQWLKSAQKAGPRAYAMAQALSEQIAQAAALDEVGRLKLINQFFDRNIHYAEDIDVWGVPDYWASPLEVLTKGQGDCEDYAIGKYFSLIAAGVPSGKLRLVYVKAQIGGPGGMVQPHMVLAYYGQPTADPLILDSLIVEIRPASQRPDLVPVFSFNAEGLWQGAGTTAAGGDPVARLSRWRDVLRKAHEEGWW